MTSGSGSKLKFAGTHEATVTGALASTLTGSQAGQAWSPGSKSASAGQWWINGVKFNGEEQLSVASTGTVKLKGGLVFLSENEMQCEGLGSSSTPTIYGGNEGKLAIALSGCTFVQPSGCKVSGTLDFASVSSALEDGEGSVFDKLGSAGGLLIKYPVEGCSLEGSYSIKGAARCKFLSSSESVVRNANSVRPAAVNSQAAPTRSCSPRW